MGIGEHFGATRDPENHPKSWSFVPVVRTVCSFIRVRVSADQAVRNCGYGSPSQQPVSVNQLLTPAKAQRAQRKRARSSYSDTWTRPFERPNVRWILFLVAPRPSAFEGQ